MKWKIQDWAGNDKSDYFGEFESFDDAEEKLCEYFDQNKMDYEEWRQEYYIVQKDEE